MFLDLTIDCEFDDYVLYVLHTGRALVIYLL